MKRALYERIAEHVDILPSEKYYLNMPQLYATTSPETRQATKAHDYSVNWVIDHGQPEIVNGSTGKTINDNTSRLSKKARKYSNFFPPIFEISTSSETQFGLLGVRNYD